MVSLGVLPGGDSSQARAVSDDGAVVVGFSNSENGTRAFRWTQASGMVSLGLLPGGSDVFGYSQAYAVSPDGSRVAGIATGVDNAQSAFSWTEAGGMVSLGNLPTGDNSEAYDVSAGA